MTETEFALLLHRYSETCAIIGRIAIRQKCSQAAVRRTFTQRVHEFLQTVTANSPDEAHT